MTEFFVDWLGADGDGVARGADGKPVYIPLTLPGERVAVEWRGKRAIPTSILAPSPDRVPPPCPHFGACGGCTLQHLADDAYAAWKAGLLRRALEKAGFADPPLAKLARSAPGTRRRMDLALRRANSRAVVVGLHERLAATVVDLQTCLVLAPSLVGLIPALRDLLPGIGGLRREGSAVANLLDSGVDLLLRTDAALSTADRARLVAFAQEQRLPRLSHAVGTDAPEPICVLRPAVTQVSGATVAPPPGAFLQATAAGEAAIVAAVLAAMPAKGWVADLFAGIGTLSLALTARGQVRAWERDGAALAALRAAAPRITTTARDLARQPLRAAELSAAAAVVLDPPWAGAAAQVAELAAPVVVYVSCNPVTLSRDAAVLRQRGYRVASAVPIDQFLWSSRLESMVTFLKG